MLFGLSELRREEEEEEDGGVGNPADRFRQTSREATSSAFAFFSPSSSSSPLFPQSPTDRESGKEEERRKSKREKQEAIEQTLRFPGPHFAELCRVVVVGSSSFRFAVLQRLP